MLAIPYEAQEHPSGCGAAALTMVYRSFGLDGTQAVVWPRVSRLRRGEPRGFTHLLGRDAESRGLRAVVVRARDPWATLTACAAASVRVILHHCLSAEETSGHYSVLVEVDAAEIVVHDPQMGPHRRVRRAEFLRLWARSGHAPEIMGHTLIAIASTGLSWACARCEQALPDSQVCKACGATVGLRPGEAIGCAGVDCPGRRWEACHCLQCDMSLWWPRAFPLNPFRRPTDARL